MAIPLEQEFEKKELFTPSEMATESRLLDSALSGGSKNLRERYLNSKKVANIDSQGKVTAVIVDSIQDYLKYNLIYSIWEKANLSKLRTNK